ncbi:MAG: IS21 family transposase [Dehalococcoidia bacterium]
MAKLGRDEIVTIEVLARQGQKHCQTARVLGVAEGTVRYHLKRSASGALDGRKKLFLIEKLGLAEAVRAWWEGQLARQPEGRPPCVEALWDFLRVEHAYAGSYKSVRRYARRKFPPPKRRPFRRVETPPGAQAQSDWTEVRDVDLGDPEGRVKVYAFVMILSHSRKEAVVWSRSMEQLCWQRVHNEAYKRLGGVAALNRIDNLKTAIARGAGPWGRVNAAYKTYARTMGFHVEACEPRCPEQKGKVERRCGALKRLGVSGRCFTSLEHLQEWTDAKLEASAQRRICPATGQSVHESWLEEKRLLRALPETLPEPFDLVKSCSVHKDCSIRFEGRSYIVPFGYLGRRVEVRGCAGRVQIVDEQGGAVLVTYPRGTPERILIDPLCYEGSATERVLAPKPLGRMARKLQELAALGVARRPVDLYAELAEVAR